MPPLSPPRPRHSFRFALPPSLGALAPGLKASLEGVLARVVGHSPEVSVAPSYELLAADLLAGRTDAIWAPPFICARLEAMGVRVLARAVRRGRSTYRAALLGRAGTGLTVERLAGKTALWVDPGSAGGYLLPLALLKARGMDPSRTFFAQHFAGSYRAALEGLLEGKADVTSIFALPEGAGGAETGVEAVLPGAGAGVSVLAFTEETPNEGIAVAVYTEARVVGALEQALMGLQENPSGAALLGGLFHAERFEPVPRLSYRALYRVSLSGL